MRIQFKGYSEFMTLKRCPECEGLGYTEYRDCNKPVSDCCGGCYKEEECKYCDGSGEVIQEDLIYFRVYKYRKNRFKKNYDSKYWKLSCGLSLDKIQKKLNSNKDIFKMLWNILNNKKK